MCGLELGEFNSTEIGSLDGSTYGTTYVNLGGLFLGALLVSVDGLELDTN